LSRADERGNLAVVRADGVEVDVRDGLPDHFKAKARPVMPLRARGSRTGCTG
jgi:hypothetical protein